MGILVIFDDGIILIDVLVIVNLVIFSSSVFVVVVIYDIIGLVIF